MSADQVRQLTEGLATIACQVSENPDGPTLEDLSQRASDLRKLLPDFERDPDDEQRDFDGKTRAESYLANFCGMPDKGILSNMLAVIHGDGGHYEGRHGTPKAAADALSVYWGFRLKAEKWDRMEAATEQMQTTRTPEETQFLRDRMTGKRP